MRPIISIPPPGRGEYPYGSISGLLSRKDELLRLREGVKFPMVHKPSWFTDGKVFISYAPTIGINKDGAELYVIDSATGTRTEIIDDQVAEDIDGIWTNAQSATSRWIDYGDLTERLIAVPAYYDERPSQEFSSFMGLPEMAEFTASSVGELISEGKLEFSNGHGSPSADLRTGSVPYIKVSDIRAGQLNINPTNRVSDVVARRFWRGETSGLRAFDLLSPIRTSKNIGDFALLMPGQEQVVLTKEILVLRPTELAGFDSFYLLWAMTLRAVRRQWSRVVFMQTNREDVGDRYREIQIPVPPSLGVAEQYLEAFRSYYLGTQELRKKFLEYLTADNRHHVFMAASVAEELETAEDELDDVDEPT